jgi:hypothetical protein
MNENHLPAIPLPATLEDMLARRKGASSRTLNSYVDEIHKGLWSDYSDKPEALGKRYRMLLDAVYDEQAVEGSLSIDNAEAARIIRNQAAKAGFDYVAAQKLAPIVKALNIVLKRYKMTRKERAVRINDNDPVAPDDMSEAA